MPLSSAEISATTGAYQQMAMGQMAYSGMIGQGMFSGMNPAMNAEGMMGGLANRAYSTGAPVLQGAMGLAGLDPFSLGMRAMSGAWGAGGGVLSAGMAGIGAAGAAAGGIAVAGYAGNQMYTGMQQQQQLNGMLRSNYSHMSPYGQGFNRSDMGQIGGTLRAMTHQGGPGGEVVGFNELSQLASNMGRMGAGGGVRDAQEFSRKFKEMITTLKTVATELNTTLEGAQQFIQSQRSSGIFRNADQMKFAMQARGTSLSGGVALSEVTAMASIGSQISRASGGLGRSGAFGGMRTMGQVGSAMQVGAISEEDIYNTTGLNGAEGRQALAASMMQQTGRFLRSSKGRWFMASVAGRNGELDESSVQNWLTGGMDVGDTKNQAHANLSQVGRANFIRNEGRLRGAVMERFGGLAPAMALSQWASGKGIDINNMDDRSMLFAQRQLGMGRDEVDTAVKMAQGLPDILRQQRLSAGDDEYQQRVASTRRGTGVEGMKRRLEHIREGIQGKLQQVGSDLFTSGSDMIEQWFNRVSGVYERRLSADVDQVWQAAKTGGAKGQGDLHRLLSGPTLGASLGQGGSRLLGGTTPDSGRKFYEQSRDQQFAARMGAVTASTSETAEFSKKSRDWVRDAYTSSLSGFEGERRISEFGSELKRRADSGDSSAKEMYQRWRSSSGRERAGMLGAIEQQVGISNKVSLGSTWELPSLGLSKGSFATVREGDVAVGRSMMGDLGYIDGGAKGWSGRRAAGILAGGAVALLGDEAATSMAGWVSGGDSVAAAAGAYVRSKEGSRLISGLMSGDGAANEAAQDRLMELRHQKERKGEETLSAGEKGEFMALAQTSLGAEYAKLSDEGAPTAKMRALEQKAEQLLGRPVTERDLRRFHANGAAALGVQARDQVEHLAERAGDEMVRRRESLLGAGVATVEKVRMGGRKGTSESLVLNKATRSQLMQGAGSGGVQAAELAITSSELARDLASAADPQAKAEILEQIANLEGQRFDKISDLSTTQKKALAKGMAGTDVGAEAGESLMRERRMSSLVRSQGGGAKGQVGAIASQLGLHFDKDQLAGLAGKSSEELSKILAGGVGSTSTDFQKSIQEAVDAMRGGKTGKGADLLQRALEQADEKTKERIKKGRDGEDPVTEAIKQAGAKQVDVLKLIARNTASTADQIAALDKLDPKDGGPTK